MATTESAPSPRTSTSDGSLYERDFHAWTE